MEEDSPFGIRTHMSFSADRFMVLGFWFSASPSGDRLPGKLPKSVRKTCSGGQATPRARTFVGIPRGDLLSIIPILTPPTKLNIGPHSSD